MSKPAKTPDALPPHSEEHERSLLGCALQNVPEVMDDLVERKVTGAWFYDLRHQMIFAAMQRVRAAGRPLEMLSLRQALKDSNELEQVGGDAYLNQVQDSVPSVASLGYYADEVRSKYRIRRMLQTLAEVSLKAREPQDDVDQFIAQSSLEILQVTDEDAQTKERMIKEEVKLVLDDMEEHYSRGRLNVPPGYLPTGFEYMDKVVGGLAPEDLFILAGRPGAGKTTLASDIIWNLATRNQWMRKTGKLGENGRPEWETVTGGCPVGVFSLEMSGKSLARRLMFRAAHVSAGKFKQGFATENDLKKLLTQAPTVAAQPVVIDDTPGQTISQIAAKARRWARKYGIKLFVLDYLQLVKPDKRGENRNRELEEVVNHLMILKKALKIPWIVLAQMNRDIEKAESSRVPQLADLKDCGAIEQACDHAFFLYLPERGKSKWKKDEQGEPYEEVDERRREEMFLEEHYADVEHTERPRRVNGFEAKNRDGATGDVQFLFHTNQFRFEDWRQWATANGFAEYGKGERKNANPSEYEEEL